MATENSVFHPCSQSSLSYTPQHMLISTYSSSLRWTPDPQAMQYLPSHLPTSSKCVTLSLGHAMVVGPFYQEYEGSTLSYLLSRCLDSDGIGRRRVTGPRGPDDPALRSAACSAPGNQPTWRLMVRDNYMFNVRRFPICPTRLARWLWLLQ